MENFYKFLKTFPQLSDNEINKILMFHNMEKYSYLTECLTDIFSHLSKNEEQNEI